MKEKVLLNVYRVLSLLLVGVLVYSNKDRIAEFLNRKDTEAVQTISESVETITAPVKISEEKNENSKFGSYSAYGNRSWRMWKHR